MKKYGMMALLGLAFNAMAAPATVPTIEKYLEVSQARKMQEETYAQIQQNLKNNIETVVKQQWGVTELSAKERVLFDEYFKIFSVKNAQIEKRFFNWETVKPMQVRAVRNTYSEEELEQLIAFYESPIGQTFIKKTPKFTSNVMNEMLPWMMQIRAASEQAAKESGVEFKRRLKNGEYDRLFRAK